jgi:hypothetical protein
MKVYQGTEFSVLQSVGTPTLCIMIVTEDFLFLLLIKQLVAGMVQIKDKKVGGGGHKKYDLGTKNWFDLVIFGYG